MSAKIVPPELGEKSFSCPHCSAIAHQTWYKVFVDSYEKDAKPWVPDADIVERIQNDRDFDGDKGRLMSFFGRKSKREF
jgi:hypothetical protein